MKKALIILVLVFFLFAMWGCSSKWMDASTTKEVNNINQPEAVLQNTQSKTARAEGKSSYGVLSVVPKESEVIEQLGAPSVYGDASDYSFKGDYNIIFEDNSGKQTVVAEMDNLQIIQPDNATIDLNKLSMDDADIFYFIPQYRGANDVSIYFFGITKDGNAFEFKIENNKAQEYGDVNALSDSTIALSTNSKEYFPPTLKNENIILKAVYNIGEGQNYEIYNVTFHVDVKDRVLKYVSKEVYSAVSQSVRKAETDKAPDPKPEEKANDKTAAGADKSESKRTSENPLPVKQADDAEKTVYQYVASIGRQDWEAYLKLLPKEQVEVMKSFLADPGNKENGIGILSVQSAKVKEIMALPEKESARFTRLDEYKARYGEIKAYLVGADYRVKIESKYIYNGVNYTLMFLGRENNQWKVIEDSSAPLEILKQDGYSFGSAEEAAAIKIIEARTRGIEINLDGKVLGYNGAKGIFLPEVTLEDGDKTADQASGVLLKAFLEHFKSGDNLQSEKIKDYRLGKTEITQKEAGGFFVFSAEFSIQTDSNSDDWFVGNVRLTEGGWVSYKLYFFTQREDNGKFKVISWTAYK